MSVLSVLGIAACWLVSGTLLGMLKWSVFHDNGPAKRWSVRYILRKSLFPESSGDWDKRASKDRNPASTPLIADYKDRDSYTGLHAACSPVPLLALIAGMMILCAIAVVQITTSITGSAVNLVARLFKSKTAPIPKSHNISEEFAEFQRNELDAPQRDFEARLRKLQNEIERLESARESVASETTYSAIAGAVQAALARVDATLQEKRRAIACTTEALTTIKSTADQIAGLGRLLQLHEMVDAMDSSGDASQQLINQAYKAMDSCRAIIRRANGIGVTLQVEAAPDGLIDTRELGRQIDAAEQFAESVTAQSEALLDETSGMSPANTETPTRLAN